MTTQPTVPAPAPRPPAPSPLTLTMALASGLRWDPRRDGARLALLGLEELCV